MLEITGHDGKTPFLFALPAITAMFQTGRQSPCRLRQSTGGKFIPNLLKLRTQNSVKLCCDRNKLVMLKDAISTAITSYFPTYLPIYLLQRSPLWSDPRDLWAWRHLIRGMRRHDLSNRNTKTNALREHPQKPHISKDVSPPQDKWKGGIPDRVSWTL